MSRTPTRDDHDKFCRVEGWVVVHGATGRPVRHHVTYEFTTRSGSLLRTRISRPVDASEYGPALWGHILRDQLKVGALEFWACVDSGVLPDRGGGATPDLTAALPASLVASLIRQVGLSEEQVRAMTKDQAIARMQEFWSSPPEM